MAAPKEGEKKTCVADMLTDDGTFKVIKKAPDGMTKMMALNEPNIMNACFGHEECINNVLQQQKQEAAKAGKKNTPDKQEFNEKLLQAIDDANTKDSDDSDKEH
jgi:hypothetical protein